MGGVGLYAKKTAKAELRQIADKLWRQKVLDKWGNRCEVCGKKAQDLHHFIRKGECQYLRYEVDNGIPLCRDHHRKADQEDNEVIQEIIKSRGREWYDRLKKKQEEAPTSFINEDWFRRNIKRLRWKL